MYNQLLSLYNDYQAFKKLINIKFIPLPELNINANRGKLSQEKYARNCSWVFESRVIGNQLTSISTFYDEPFPFSIEILSVSSSNSSPSSVTLYQFTLSGFLGSFSFTWILSNHQDMNFLYMQTWNYSSLWPVSIKHSLISFLLKYSIEDFIF